MNAFNFTFTFDWSHLNDALQIAILYFVFYGILKAARGSRFGQVLLGVAILFGGLLVFTFLFHFYVLALIIKWILIYLAISTVVLFQPEIRRVLATIGSFIFPETRRHAVRRTTPEFFVECVFHLAQRKLGALFAFERAISLRSYEASGVAIDALPSPEILVSIFTEPMPLHDGGMIVRGGRLASAHCLFPVSSRGDLSSSGMRHRAAVGLSEETDALVVVVSEETGRVSIAYNGRLIRYPDSSEDSRQALLRWIAKAMPQKKTALEAIGAWLRKRLAVFRPTKGTKEVKPASGGKESA